MAVVEMFGPPGSGKTTLKNILEEELGFVGKRAALIKRKVKPDIAQNILPDRVLRVLTKTRGKDFSSLIWAFDEREREALKEMVDFLGERIEGDSFKKDLAQDLDYLLAGRDFGNRRVLLLDEGVAHRVLIAVNRGLSLSVAKKLISQLPVPDAYLYLKVPESVRMERLWERDGEVGLQVSTDISDAVADVLNSREDCSFHQINYRDLRPEKVMATMRAVLDSINVL